jgi:hypothetical protein
VQVPLDRDPTEEELAVYRRVRDEIRDFVASRLPSLIPAWSDIASVSTPAADPAAGTTAAADPVAGTTAAAENAVGSVDAATAEVAPPAASVDAAKAGGEPTVAVALADGTPASAAAAPARPRLSCFDAYLSVWVLLCIVVGTLIGYFAPAAASALAAAQVSQTSIPIAVLLWLMIFPMLLQIDFAALRHVGRQPGAIALTTVINFAVQPFTMYGLAMLFFRAVYTTVITDRKTQDEYIAGAVLLGGAPCTAMVFVWSLLVGGSPGYTLMQVSTEGPGEGGGGEGSGLLRCGWHTGRGRQPSLLCTGRARQPSLLCTGRARQPSLLCTGRARQPSLLCPARTEGAPTAWQLKQWHTALMSPAAMFPLVCHSPSIRNDSMSLVIPRGAAGHWKRGGRRPVRAPCD